MCPQNSVILRFLSGELTPEARSEFQTHLETCGVCRSAYEDLRASWDVLGGWQLDLDGVDLRERVLAEAEAVGRRQVRAVRWTVPLRAAASLAAAVGLGVGVGHLVPVARSVSPVVAKSAVATEDVTESLGLVEFASKAATGLALDFERDEPLAGGETP